MPDIYAVYRFYRDKCRMGRCRAFVKTIWTFA